MVVSNLLKSTEITTNYIYLAKNVYDNLDWIWPWVERIRGTFYTIDRVVSRPKVQAIEPEALYVTGIFEFGE